MSSIGDSYNYKSSEKDIDNYIIFKKDFLINYDNINKHLGLDFNFSNLIFR